MDHDKNFTVRGLLNFENDSPDARIPGSTLASTNVNPSRKRWVRDPEYSVLEGTCDDYLAYERSYMHKRWKSNAQIN